MAFLDRDGVKLFYEDTGSGDPPLLLVHGWTCNHTHWAGQVRHFGPRHRVITVDLRGHGRSDAPEQDYTHEGFAGDLAWLCDKLGVKRPVVIGHSMGGIVTLVMAATRPEVVRAGVLVDSPFPPIPAGNQSRLASAIEALSAPDYLDFARGFIETMFSPLDDPARKRQIMEGMLSTPQHVMHGALKFHAATDTIAAAKACTQPMLVISAGYMTFASMGRLESEFPSFRAARTFGSGHFNMVEVPDQVNAMIDRFLATDVAACL
jgi:pimeloyl-ACP methyl ester carboxylesterase